MAGWRSLSDASIMHNTIVGYSYSKSLSLPGERIGYLVIPDEVEDSETIWPRRRCDPHPRLCKRAYLCSRRWCAQMYQ